MGVVSVLASLLPAESGRGKHYDRKSGLRGVVYNRRMLSLRRFRHRLLLLCLLATFVLPAFTCWAADACCEGKAASAHAACADGDEGAPCGSDCGDESCPPESCPCVVCHVAAAFGIQPTLRAPELVGTLDLRVADDPLPGFPPDIFRPPLA
jgi:hypothetical protein